MTPTIQRLGPLLTAGVLLGVAFAAFFDGIVLHQILQWHHMICDERTCAPQSITDLQHKDRADGFFHLAAYGVLLSGVFQLFRAGKTPGVAWSTTAFAGALLVGFGGFNVIEGVIDHHILQIHHVRFGPNRPIWDLGFLVLSTMIWSIGLWLIRRARSSARHDPNRRR